jgi:stage II sporulation protein D
MLRVFFLITFICFFQSLIAQTIRIGLFTGSKIKELQLQIGQGSYLMQVKAENSGLGLLKQINPDDTYLLKPYNGMVQVYSKGQLFLQGETILLQQKNLEDFCNWTILSPSSKMRSYEGDFELVNFKGDLRLINNLDIETYLEGVVSSEGGDGQRLAYYEAQAVISRTYALSNLNRHQNENFALCERVHCQAYLNKRKGSVIIDTAVQHTKGLVLLNDESTYYPTFFHANCGGQTCEPQYIWNEPIQGLQSFRDTFCIHTKQAHWVKSIPLHQWTDFLVEKYNFPVFDSSSVALMQAFRQDQRMAFYLNPVYGIPLRDLRDHFKLKSTFFDAIIVGQEVILYGKGFGHGVGLCQEGAMQMARKGYTFDQILRFYYPNASLAK